MKKAITILAASLLLSCLLKAQVFVSGGLGLEVNQASPVAEVNAGYKIPFSDCAPRLFNEGLMVSAGYTSVTDENKGAFNIKIGKSFYLNDWSELQVLTGYQLEKLNAKESRAGIVTVNYVHAFSYKVSWIVSGSGSKNFFSGTIGLRYLFVR